MSEVSRREFLVASAGTVALGLIEEGCCPTTAAEKLGTHHIPADKNLTPAWVKGLFARGQSKVYRGDELTCIGMPIGGICAGQLYLRGDGTLADWHIFNEENFTGYGDNCYRTYTPPAPVQQGFGIWVKTADGKTTYRKLDRSGFPNVEFVGEYPIGRVRYVRAADDPLPVEVTLEAFSPFIPLDANDSGIPGTILRFRIRNTSDKPVQATINGFLQNTVCHQYAGKLPARRLNVVKHRKGMTAVVLTAETARFPAAGKVDKPEVFADFESGTYGDWKKTETCFGERPSTGTLPHQQPVTGFGGKYLVNTYHGGDQSTGTLTSPKFVIRRPYIHFRIGGGKNPGKTCINLKLGDKVVRTATGKNNEKLEWDCWWVGDFKGREATIEIVDQATGGWGHINIDDIQFADEPPGDLKRGRLEDLPQFGTLVLAVLDARARSDAWDRPERRTDGRVRFADTSGASLYELDQTERAALEATEFVLLAGESREIVFLVTWHFANGEHGKRYGNRFQNALGVAEYLRTNLDRLTRLTHLFHDTYYDSTLPHWLLDRLMMPVSTLATGTCQWWKNGRFWAWEGVGCCHGTCTHVWNYAQAVAHLFPELERSARTMQDLGPAFDSKTGRVAFRGEGPGFPYAADGQCGTVLKCYREHLMSKDSEFLKANWPLIKKVMEYSIAQDGNADGVIENQQHNTYDINFVGPNTFVGALYLAALETAARMADEQGDKPFAQRCRAIAERGRRWSVEHLWNGAYFVQRIPAGQPTKFQYGDGCLADQLFGQTWADLLDLGYVYPRDKVRTALQSIYRYNWAPDVAAQNQAHPPQRWFARPGEAGLFICTWPKGGRMAEPVLYRDEVWTGCEYQVATALIHEGMIREAFSIIRGVRDRYDGRRHNPWNEVECGDHYARALASWGCLLALSGFVYDGPAGHLEFAPRWQAEDFKALFTAAEGWGSLSQRRTERAQENRIHVHEGRVAVRQLRFEVPDGKTVTRFRVSAGGLALNMAHAQDGTRVRLTLETPFVVPAGGSLVTALDW